MRRIATIALALVVLVAGGGLLISALLVPRSPGQANAEQGAAAGKAGDWPMFRGDSGMMGVAPGTLPDALALRWRFKTHREVTSSPVVAGGRVYVGSMDANVYCIDLAKGAKLWNFPTRDAVEAPPLVVEQTVYVGSNDSFLYALDAATGKLRWKFETGDKILGSANAFRHPNSGKLRIVVGSYDYDLYCLDPATGAKVWTYESGNYINGGVAVAGGRSVFGGCDARLHVVGPDGKDANTVEAGAYVAATAAFDGRRAYVGNYEGGFACIDTATGRTRWTYKGEDPFVSSPAVGGDRVVVGCNDGRLYCFDRDSGRKLWTFRTGDEINGCPVLCGQKVLFGSNDGKLYIVRLADGGKVWSYALGEAIVSSPAVAGDYVLIGCDDGYVYAFGPRPQAAPAEGR